MRVHRRRAAEYLAARLPAMLVVERGQPRLLGAVERVDRVARELPDVMVAAWAAARTEAGVTRDAPQA